MLAALCSAVLSMTFLAAQLMLLTVDNSKKLRDGDGFGVNYVKASQSRDYDKDPEEYGGFSLLRGELGTPAHFFYGNWPASLIC